MDHDHDNDETRAVNPDSAAATHNAASEAQNLLRPTPPTRTVDGAWRDGLCACRHNWRSCCCACWPCTRPCRRMETMIRLVPACGILERKARVLILLYLLSALIACPLLLWLLDPHDDRHWPVSAPLAIASFVLLTWLGAYVRGHLRQRYGIPGSRLHDVLVHICCASCALAQEARHVDGDDHSACLVLRV